jgi:hypothetical protein
MPLLAQRLLIGLFLGALLLPAVDRRLRPGQIEHVKAELRNPERWPDPPLDFYKLKRWPERIERWHGDALGLRDHLIRWNNYQRVVAFHKAPSDTHVIGKEGFVMFAGHESQAIWRGRKQLPKAHLEAWCQAIRERRERFAAEGIRYWFCVAPNKETIYPDMLLAGEERHGETPLMQLDRVLRERGESAWVDLRPALLAERENDRPEQDDWTYLRLGSHYSYRGGTSVALALAERGRAEGLGFPVLGRELWECRGISYWDIEDCIPLTWHLGEWSHEPAFRMSLASGSRVRVTEQSAEQFPMRMRFEGPQGLPSVVLVHDSFGQWTRQMFAEFCSRLQTRWQYYMPVGEIFAQHPDLVIQMVTERHLRNQPEPLELTLRTLTHGNFRTLGRVEAFEGWQQRLRPHLDTQLVAEGPDIAIDCDVGKDKFYYPVPQLAAGCFPALRIELSSQAAGHMYVWFQTREDPKYQKVRRLIVPVEAGRAELCLLIPTEAPPGDLLIQPIDARERVIVHAIEVRSCSESQR